MPNLYHFAYLTLLLYAGHALCDYPLQGDFLSQGKNRLLKGIPWYQCLWSHGLIHAGMVLLVTRSLALALAELVAHLAIDYSKGRGRLTFNQDQFLHFTCKLLWAAVIVWGWQFAKDVIEGYVLTDLLILGTIIVVSYYLANRITKYIYRRWL